MLALVLACVFLATAHAPPDALPTLVAEVDHGWTLVASTTPGEVVRILDARGGVVALAVDRGRALCVPCATGPVARSEPLAQQPLGVFAYDDIGVVRSWQPGAGERWDVYYLETARRLDQAFPAHLLAGSPRRADLGRLLDVRPLPDRPLVLVAYEVGSGSLESGSFVGRGVAFALFEYGMDIALVWSLRLADDYVIEGQPAAQRRLVERVNVRGAVLEVGTRHVDLRFHRAGQRVRFAVDRIADEEATLPVTWRVRELGRAPLVE